MARRNGTGPFLGIDHTAVAISDWASVRRSPIRRPTMATANISTALTATQPRPHVPPTSSCNRFTPSDPQLGPAVRPVATRRTGGGLGCQLRPAMTPPSTSQMAPVTQLVAGESRNVMVLARSRTVPVRPSGWKPSKLCRVSSSLSFGTNLL